VLARCAAVIINKRFFVSIFGGKGWGCLPTMYRAAAPWLPPAVPLRSFSRVTLFCQDQIHLLSHFKGLQRRLQIVRQQLRFGSEAMQLLMGL
jgi:hypothetical protein